MAQPRKPQDHKSKKQEEPEAFSFTVEVDGEEVTHTLAPTYTVLTPGFLRANRRRDEVDQFFTMLEALAAPLGAAGQAALEAVDGMSRPEFKALMLDFYAHLDAAPGE